MGTAGQVEGLAGALLRCVDEPDRIAGIQVLLDRYCHRLRNRLNSIKLSLYLARRLAGDPAGADWERADTSYRAMELLIEQLQTFCGPIAIAPTGGDLNRWIEDRLGPWRRLLDDRPIRLEVDGPGEPLPTCCDWPRLGQGLDRLIDAWASLGPADATLRLTWGRGFERCYVRFEGDGWVVRPDREVENLALPLLARVLREHRGTLVLPEDASSVELNWPSEHPWSPMEAPR